MRRVPRSHPATLRGWWRLLKDFLMLSVFLCYKREFELRLL